MTKKSGKRRAVLRLAGIILVLALASGCATAPTQAEKREPEGPEAYMYRCGDGKQVYLQMTEGNTAYLKADSIAFRMSVRKSKTEVKYVSADGRVTFVTMGDSALLDYETGATTSCGLVGSTKRNASAPFLLGKMVK